MSKYFRLRRWWWWSEENREKFKRRLKRISPYILILLLPGSFILLPLYALWREWMHRRRRPEPVLLISDRRKSD